MLKNKMKFQLSYIKDFTEAFIIKTGKSWEKPGKIRDSPCWMVSHFLPVLIMKATLSLVHKQIWLSILRYSLVSKKRYVCYSKQRLT